MDQKEVAYSTNKLDQMWFSRRFCSTRIGAGLRSVMLTLFWFLSLYGVSWLEKKCNAHAVLVLKCIWSRIGVERSNTIYQEKGSTNFFKRKEVLKIICSLIYLIVTEMSNSTISSLFFIELILYLEDRRILCDIHKSKTKEGRDIISGD